MKCSLQGFFLKMNKETISKLISFIDLTSLNSVDNQLNIQQLVELANLGHFGNFVSGVCVFANHGDYARFHLNEHIKTVVVAGNFPHGQATIEAKIQELKLITESSIDEVDLVINRGELIAGNYNYTAKEIEVSKTTIGEKKLKVILETGELTKKQIAKASIIAIENGADFIKTSTGKATFGATEDSAKVICNEIKKSNLPIGFKASGGIRSYSDVMLYYNIVKNILGDDFLTPDLFRIGASSLYKTLINNYNEI